VVTGLAPTERDLSGSTAIVTFGDGSTLGYPVSGVKESQGEVCLVLADDPGVAVNAEGMRHLFCPRREIPGPVRYRLRTSALSGRDPDTGKMVVTSSGSAQLLGG
jgi:hypothetical protein